MLLQADLREKDYGDAARLSGLCTVHRNSHPPASEKSRYGWIVFAEITSRMRSSLFPPTLPANYAAYFSTTKFILLRMELIWKACNRPYRQRISALQNPTHITLESSDDWNR